MEHHGPGGIAMMVAVPRFTMHDLLMKGGWEEWNGWIWWVWSFAGGWCEWVPATVQLIQFHLSWGQHKPLNTEDALERVSESLVELHEVLGLPCDAASLQTMMTEQLQYKALSKSEWYYNSQPQYSTLVNF